MLHLPVPRTLGLRPNPHAPPWEQCCDQCSSQCPPPNLLLQDSTCPLINEDTLLKWLDFSAAAGDVELARLGWQALNLSLDICNSRTPRPQQDIPSPAAYHSYIHALAAGGSTRDAFWYTSPRAILTSSLPTLMPFAATLRWPTLRSVRPLGRWRSWSVPTRTGQTWSPRSLL